MGVGRINPEALRSQDGQDQAIRSLSLRVPQGVDEMACPLVAGGAVLLNPCHEIRATLGAVREHEDSEGQGYRHRMENRRRS
jgi:hypothetical protein